MTSTIDTKLKNRITELQPDEKKNISCVACFSVNTVPLPRTCLPTGGELCRVCMFFLSVCASSWYSGSPPHPKNMSINSTGYSWHEHECEWWPVCLLALISNLTRVPHLLLKVIWISSFDHAWMNGWINEWINYWIELCCVCMWTMSTNW